MHTEPLIVANWKMNLPLHEAINFATMHRDGLHALAQHCSLMICPSFVALYPLAQLFKASAIQLGAQNCAAYVKGAYTGEVDALSLKQVGCQYTIVGHAERRRYFHEDNQIIKQKITRLVEQEIIPILCIGESEKSDIHTARAVLREQLSALQGTSARSATIAYEPVWAIGTGAVPEPAYLTAIYQEITQFLATHLPELSYRLLYGGSIDEQTLPTIAATGAIDGFLVGGASLDFQKLQNIVSLARKSSAHASHG